MTRILFVCLGNICRSPMAEFTMKALLKAHGLEDFFHIESAAISSEEVGNPIYPPAKRCLSQHGVAFDSLKRARQIRPEDYGRFDLILLMDESNMRLIKRIIPSDPERKIRLLSTYSGTGRDIADPYYTGDFETAFQDILEGCEGLLSSMQ